MNGKKIFILFCLLLFPGIIFAQDISHGKLNFEEFDGTPSVYPYKMKVTNGTLTDNLDGTASLDFPGAMAYPGAGIVVSNGTAWGTSIPDNSTNWNTAYGWGNHSSAGYIKNLTSFTTDNLTQGSTNKYANTTKEDNGQTAYTWGDQSGKADYNFTSNNFNGTGNFTSTGIISGSNLSGNNTGDETNSTILSKLGFTPYYPGGTDVTVSDGGTGKSSWTQYLIPYANTTTSFDQIPIGTSGQVLTSNGAGSVASFQNATSGNPFNQVLNTTSNVTFGTVNGNSTTQSQGNNSTLLSTTGYVDIGLGTKAPLASPSFTTKISTPQISFPATQSASSDPNTLDEYEEGTWTPASATLTVVGTPTFTGHYVRIGRVVYIEALLSATTSIAAATGNTITGLPFAVATGLYLEAWFQDGNVANLGIGQFQSSQIYVGTGWAANSNGVLISGFYFTAT